MAVQGAVDLWLRNNNGMTFQSTTFINQKINANYWLKTTSGANGPASRKILLYDTRQMASAQPVWVMRKEHWDVFWDFVENLKTYFTPNTYPKVKLDEDWKRLYELDARNITFESDMGPYQRLVPETMACKKCKIVLPFDCITVDHQKPQTGGENDAVFKMFKALGLTIDAFKPRGRKAKFWGKRDGFTFDFQNDPTVGWFNWAGLVFYSILVESGQLDKFAIACIHHAINLQPLCFHCNSKKGNWGY